MTHHEKLESRKLLAVDAGVGGTTFGIRGTAGADDVAVLINDTTATVTESGVDTDYDLSGVTRFRFFLDAGDDAIDIRIDRSARLVGSAMTVYGGAGDDNITVDDDPISLDTYLLSGDDGNDTIGFAGNDSGSFRGRATVYGGAGNDLIVGGNSRDLLSGDDGDDSLYGMAKQDVLLGGAGVDELFGGTGNGDVLNGGAGADVLIGSGGGFSFTPNVFDPADVQDAAKSDFVPTRDLLFTDPDVGDLSSGQSSEAAAIVQGRVLTLVGSNNQLSGDGDDAIGVRVAPSSTDTLTIDGTVNAFIPLADLDAVRVYLNDGDDSLDLVNLPSDLPTTVYGGAGNDSVRAIATSAGPGVSIRTPIVRFYGGDGNDAFVGTGGRPAKKILYGGAGNDTLSGAESADYIDGGDGNDDLAGYDGADLLLGGEGNDRLDGGKGNEFSPTTGQPDTLRGGPGDDILNGWGGDDVVFGDDGADLFAEYELNGNIGEPVTSPLTVPFDEPAGQVKDYDELEDLLA